MRANVRWYRDGYRVSGVERAVLEKVVEALRKEGTYDQATVSQRVELVVVELIGLGIETGVAVEPAHVLKHVACGAVFTPQEWNERNGTRQPVVSATTGREVWVQLRPCRCGRWITQASLEVQAVEMVCNAKGGAA